MTTLIRRWVNDMRAGRQLRRRSSHLSTAREIAVTLATIYESRIRIIIQAGTKMNGIQNHCLLTLISNTCV